MINFLISSIVGFLFWKFFSGKHEGDKLERSLRFKVGKFYVHLHHWLWCSAILVTLWLVGFYHPTAFGLLVGSIIQGLTYQDWHYIIYRQENYERIYSRFKKVE